MGENNGSKKALLVIDIQEDATGKMSKSLFKNTENFINSANLTIKKFQENSDDVFYIKHEINNNLINRIITGNRFIKDTPGSEIDSRILKINNNIYSKNKGDAFSNKELRKVIRDSGIEEIYIIGLDARFCIYSTALGSVKKGYKTFVIENVLLTGNMGKLPELLKKYIRKGINVISV